MAILTYTQQLENVQTAITAIENGAQSYTIDGDSYTRANLDVLYKREERLRKLATRESNGGISVRNATPANGR